jgi:hypothetical protein
MYETQNGIEGKKRGHIAMLSNLTSYPHFIWQAVQNGHTDIVPTLADSSLTL